MSNEIIINASPEETRIALLENKLLTELYFDRKRDRGIVGNVYKGVVEKVLPGMQAAFVDITTEKAAFLYVDDIVTEKEKSSAEMEEVDEAEFEEGVADTKIVEGGGEEGEETEPSDAARETVPMMTQSKRGSHTSIEGLLKAGQEVVVQVSKGPIGTKGPRITGFVSLPGRFLVYMPLVNHLGISRRIGTDEERRRLKEMICRLRKGTGGYIVRTVSEGITEKELHDDMAFLDLVWENTLKKRNEMKAPALLHTDSDLIFRTVRDAFTKEIDRLIIDSKTEYDRITEIVRTSFPEFLSRVELWESKEPIFEAYGIEAEMTKARNRRVWLKSGGYLVIDRTEALTVIDVNTGRFVGKQGLEETILKTNMEAAKETARQLRLRNIGGIIIIDFIDMEREKNREKVFRALGEAVSRDKAKTRLIKISDLGLVEMSRERTQEALTRILSDPCPYCEGSGYTKSPTTICYEIFREIRQMTPREKDKKIVIAAHPAVVGHLYNRERQAMEALEKGHNKKIILQVDANFHIEHYDIYLL